MNKSSKKFRLPVLIKDYRFKQLLQSIEQSDKSTYKDFVLSELTPQELDYFGESGSSLRRAFQQVLPRLKRKSPPSYLKLLKQYNIVPSSKTMSLVQDKNISHESDEDRSIDFSMNDPEDRINSDYENEEGNESVKLAGKFEKLSFSKPSPVRQRYTPTRKKKYLIPPTPPRSVSGLTDYTATSSQLNVANFNEFIATYGIEDPEYLIIQCGTKSNPYITFVDTKFPERNGGMFGVEINFVSDIQHANFKRQGYKIRLNVTPMDYEEYEMTIPSEYELPQFVSRCTMLKGPSRNFWHRENAIFENIAENKLDEATKNAFQRDTLQVKRDEKRHHSYHLFVFPVGTTLDNNIFSGASNRIKADQIPLKLTHNNACNKFNKQMNQFELIWTIGVKGGEELSDTTAEVEYSKLF